MMTLVNCLVMICRSGCAFSSAFAWWSQPNADVLSANDKKHDNGGASPLRIVIQMQKNDATNSNVLFSFSRNGKNSDGIWNHHACLLTE